MYNVDDHWMANFCMYSYLEPEELKKMFPMKNQGRIWTFDKRDFYSSGTFMNDTQCCIFTSSNVTTSNAIALVFRGTDTVAMGKRKSFIDWWVNAENVYDSLEEFPVSNLPGNPSLVGAGWLGAWGSVKKIVVARLRELLANLNPKLTTIYVTGHSQGGAVAIIAAADIYRELLLNNEDSPSLHVTSIATPLVGNKMFVSYMNFIKPRFGWRGNFKIYRDPTDPILWANHCILSLRGFNDFDPEDIVVTRKGKGHEISNYISLMASGPDRKPSVRKAVAEPQGILPSTFSTLAPDDSLTSLTINLAISEDYQFDPDNPPNFHLSLVIGVNKNGTGGKYSVPLLNPGSWDSIKTYTVHMLHTTFSSYEHIQVSDLRHCMLVISTESGSLTSSHPLLLDGIQLLVNDQHFFTDFSMGISVSEENNNYKLEFPTPHYQIVGGRMLVTNNTSSEKKIEVSAWGKHSPKEVLKEVLIEHGYCKSKQYGDNSYFNSYLYLVPSGEEFATRAQRVVGGQMEVTNGDESKPKAIVQYWGQEWSTKVQQSYGKSWSDFYHEGNSYTSFFLSEAGVTPAYDEPKVIGGRMLITDKESKKPKKETLFWGERSEHEIAISQGYCWSMEYAEDSYGYLTFYVDRPTRTGGFVNTTLQIELVSIKCVKPSEWEYDEIYLYMNGEQYWPKTSYKEMKKGDNPPINLKFETSLKSPARLELWENDLTWDNLLYEYSFNFNTPVLDIDTKEYVDLQNCKQDRVYQLAHRSVDPKAIYYLFIKVVKK